MRNYVIINEINSNTIQGLAINILPPITKPMMRSQIEEIDGRDGDIITTLGYSAYDKTITIGLFGSYDVNEVIAFFNQSGTIVFSNEEDKYYNFFLALYHMLLNLRPFCHCARQSGHTHVHLLRLMYSCLILL